MAAKLPCHDRTYTPVKCAPANVARGAWVLAATILGSAMPGIDATAVNLALPVLQRDLHAGADAVQWVVEAYALFLSALILAGGSLGDKFGRRRMYVIGVAIFGAASIACAASQNIAQLIGARCVQGIGGALLVPESLALIAASFDEKHRGAAIGTWSGFLAATMAVGPLLGGWLVQSLSWRLIFVINIPVAVAVVFITARFVDESRDEDARRIDWAGAATATLSLGLLTYGFIALQNAPTERLGGAAVVGGFCLMALFAYIEHRSAEPMIPLGIFSSRAFTVANIYTLLMYAALGAALFFLPFNLINVQHYPPFAAGAALLPMILLMFFSSRWSGGMVARTGARLPLTAGAIAAGCGFAMLGFAGIGGSYWTTFFPGVVLLGIGTSTFVAPLTTTVMNSAPAQHAGSASGINNAISRVAGLLAIALLGIIIVASTGSAVRVFDRGLPAQVRRTLESDSLLTGRTPDRGYPAALRPAAERAVNQAYAIGFRDVMLVCTALAWISAFSALSVPRGLFLLSRSGTLKA